MNKNFFITFLLFVFILPQNAFCDFIADPNKYLQRESFMEKISFWKKSVKKQRAKYYAPKMPKTYQQWEKISKSEPLIKRENPKTAPEVNPKLTKVLSPKAYFVKYNNPPGEAEADISKIIHSSNENSEGVVDEKFSKLAYVSYFYYPTYNQISSKLFVLPLDMKETRIKRIENANILKAPKVYDFSTNMDTLKENYYSMLTVLDWSKDSDFLLIKKKDGSSKSGLFRTTLYRVDIDEDGEILTHKKIDFEKAIKKYWENGNDIALNLYRWDIKPLGFNAEDESEVISYAWGYDKRKNKIFLGAWGADIETGEVYLLSKDYVPFEISSHGIILKYQLP